MLGRQVHGSIQVLEPLQTPHVAFEATLAIAELGHACTLHKRSIALITLSWPRLTWPRLASRQAGPWSRKISATSRTGRVMRDRRQAGGPSFGNISRSSGLITVRSTLVATWV